MVLCGWLGGVLWVLRWCLCGLFRRGSVGQGKVVVGGLGISGENGFSFIKDSKSKVNKGVSWQISGKLCGGIESWFVFP